jgi:hypothetical protein
MLIFISSAVTYCCFLLDLNYLSHCNYWISQPATVLYVNELVSLLVLIAVMTWLGSTPRYIHEYTAVILSNA